jgi:hypothetical protein
MDGTIRTPPRVLHILGLDRNLSCVSKMDDAGVEIMFEKECSRGNGVVERVSNWNFV